MGDNADSMRAGQVRPQKGECGTPLMRAIRASENQVEVGRCTGEFWVWQPYFCESQQHR